MTVKETCLKAKEHSGEIAFAGEDKMNMMLIAAAHALRDHAGYIIAENQKDVDACTRGPQFADRLMLNEKRIDGIAAGLEKLVQLKCPVGEVLEERELYNGLQLRRVRVPLGVLGIIYEARPNVTADAIGLAIKSGNAVVLRGSKDALRSNKAVTSVIKNALRESGFDPEFIQLIEDATHEGATEFMRMNGIVDVIIPRGSAALIQNAVKNATVPIIETGTGNCHVYFENTADFAKAMPILLNAKTQRVGVCNAAEKLLVHRDVAEGFLPVAAQALANAHVAIRADETAYRIIGQSHILDLDLAHADEQDWDTEYLALKIGIKVVDSLDEAIAHINAHSTGHTESIIAEDYSAVETFTQRIDSAVVMVNASTRFTDGGVFGFGAELGISTQKMHARGPMGLREMTTTKWIGYGTGQVRA